MLGRDGTVVFGLWVRLAAIAIAGAAAESNDAEWHRLRLYLRLLPRPHQWRSLPDHPLGYRRQNLRSGPA